MFTHPPGRLGADGLPERDSVADLLLRTLPGRALVVGAGIRLFAWLAQLVVGRTPLTDAVGTVGTLALLAGVTFFAARLIGLARRRLLWRVRRKLILSFIFVGLVPALLIIVFFALCGMLLFSSISSYVVQTRLRSLAEQAQFIAQTTALELSRAPAAAPIWRTGSSGSRRRSNALSGGVAGPRAGVADLSVRRARRHAVRRARRGGGHRPVAAPGGAEHGARLGRLRRLLRADGVLGGPSGIAADPPPTRQRRR